MNTDHIQQGERTLSEYLQAFMLELVELEKDLDSEIKNHAGH